MSLNRTFAALALAAAAVAGEPHTAEQRYKMFQQYLAARGAEVSRASLAGIRDLDEWRRRRPEVLRHIRYDLGLDPMPAKTPLRARVTGALDRDGYRVEKIVFESMPGLFVTGNLYLPAARTAPAPTVLYVCGHSPGPAGAKVRYQHHGIWFARHGYAAFLLDTVEFGELGGIHHGTHDLGMWYWQSLGYTPAGPEVWNAIRALDYLETRPEVDSKRFAITGISGGGAITWYAAAIDERFRAAASVCATWTAGQHIALDAVQENCDCIYFPNTFQDDLPSVGALIAPRPFKILGAKLDESFPPAGYRDAYEQTRRIYELHGAGGKVAMFEAEARHQDIPAFRKEADEWLNRWLRDDTTPFEEGEIRREADENLAVLNAPPVGALNGQIHKRFIRTAALAAPKSLEEWKARRNAVLRELRDKVFRGFPGEKVPFDAWKQVEDGWTSRYAQSFNVEFTTEQGIRVNGQLFIPRARRESYPALIYFKGAEDVVYPVDYDPLLPVFATHVILVLHPRATDYPGVTNYRMANIRMSAALIGSTVESQQLWDLLRSLDYLTESEGLRLSGVSVYGRRHMGALALYAGALDSRVTRVILDDPPASHWQAPALLNVLRITDLPEAAALMAPREIVSLSRVPEAYRFTSRIFGLHGIKGAPREAGDLGEALGVWEIR
ncbi:MAG: acetylxylan esterase [Acidobacteriota bacterium]